MKKSILFILTSFFTHLTFAQDLIVTKKNDSINCKIRKIETNLITFQYKPQTQVLESLIATSQVAYIQKNFFKDNPNITDSSNDQSSKLKISLSGGLSYRTAAIEKDLPEDITNHYKKQKWGNMINLDAIYYLNEKNGIGLKYLNSNYNASSIISLDTYYSIDEDVSIKFIGPIYSSQENYNKSTVFYNLGLGYLGYNSTAIIDFSNTVEATGNNIGFLVELGYDYAVSNEISIGANATYISGKINEFLIEGQTFEAEENIGNINLSIGIKFKL